MDDDVVVEGDAGKAEAEAAGVKSEAAAPVTEADEATVVAPVVQAKPKRNKSKRGKAKRKAARRTARPVGEPAPVERTDANLRLELARALKEQARAAAALQRQRKAVDALWRDILAAEAEIEAAQKNVKKAAEEDARALAQASVDGRKAPASKVQAARLAVTVAEDSLAALREAKKIAERDVPMWSQEMHNAEAAVDTVISAILERHARTVLAKAKKAAAALAPLQAALSALRADLGPMQVGGDLIYHDGWKPLAAMKEDIRTFLSSLNNFERVHPSPWVEARKNLKADPAATLDALDALL